MREVADRHPGVGREREARKRGPRHRFRGPAGAAAGGCRGCAGLRFRVGGVTKNEDPAPKRPFRVGGSQEWEIRRREMAIPRGRGHKIYILSTSRSSASGGCCLAIRLNLLRSINTQWCIINGKHHPPQTTSGVVNKLQFSLKF